MFAPEVICFTSNPNDLVSPTAPFGTALMSSTNMLLTRCYKEFSWSEKCKNICWQMDHNMDDNHYSWLTQHFFPYFFAFLFVTERAENIKFYRYDFIFLLHALVYVGNKIQTLTSIRGDLFKLLKSCLTFSFRSFKGISTFFLKEVDT